MPKERLNIPSFQGGLNLALDPRDIQNAELSNGTNVSYDTNGIIKPIGRSADFLSDIIAFPHNNIEASDIRGGRNLFYFESNFQSGDATVPENQSTTWADSSPYLLSEKFSHTVFDGGDGDIDETGSQHWYLFGTDFDDAGSPGVHVIQVGHTAWNEHFIMPYDYLGAGKKLHCVFHYNNNAVRVNNSNNNYACRSKWFGFIRQKDLFDGANSVTSDYHFNGWYELDNDIKKPTDIKFISFAGSPAGDVGSGTGFEVKTFATTGGGLSFDDEMTEDELKYDLAISFIYDGIQESLLYEEGNKTLTDDEGNTVIPGNFNALSVQVMVKTGYNPRITGGRVYYKVYQSSDDYVLLCDIDFEKGIRASLDSVYPTTGAWTAIGGSGGPEATMYSNVAKLTSENLDTYSSLTEWGINETRISIGCTGGNYPVNTSFGYGETYEASTISNGRCFIANTRLYKTEGTNAIPNSNYRGYSIEPNRIYYSGTCSKNGATHQPAYDCFPRSNFLDIETEDSSGFTALFGFADRLFAFKKDILLIINIAGDPNANEWFVESEHQGLGINLSAQFAQFDEGAVWANSTGVYVYTGNDIKTSSSENVDFQVDIQNIWYDKLGNPGDRLPAPLVGFSRPDKSIVIHADMNNSNAGTWIYNFKTDNWTKCNTLTRITDSEPGRDVSNFIIGSNGRLVFAKENDSLITAAEKMVNHNFPANGYDGLSDGDHSWDNGDGTIDGWPSSGSNSSGIFLSKNTADSQNGWLKITYTDATDDEGSDKKNVHYGPIALTQDIAVGLMGIMYSQMTETEGRVVTISFVSNTSDSEEAQLNTNVIALEDQGVGNYRGFGFPETPFEGETGNYYFRIRITWPGQSYHVSETEYFFFGSIASPGLYQLDYGNNEPTVGFFALDVNNNSLDSHADFFCNTGMQFIVTKDFDFGQPGLKKRIYNLFCTYSTDSAHSAPISYALDGSNDFVNMIGDFDDTERKWKAGRFRPSSVVTCQSIKFKVRNTANDKAFRLNDMTIEHRITSRRIA